MSEKTSISCRRETLEKARRKKRGGESWDSLIRKMADNYTPTTPEDNEF
jgi:hypothetical protein